MLLLQLYCYCRFVKCPDGEILRLYELLLCRTIRVIYTLHQIHTVAVCDVVYTAAVVNMGFLLSMNC